ncbi:SIR2 family protein [Paenibacillus sp. OK003]|uniref:SIR2 family protein n=1 Tax=Paenibacillus sp. OK003 TaxID=1884380 RepID=UPI0008D519F2|nr:SIR2 family protein [Paenibacillus sp. OK003]SEK28890.1 SIR2-like domain-containing protein [Paenibacillus sp. OK003]
MDDISKEIFIRDYEKAVFQESAAIFAGAGLSQNSGFVNWKELLRELAREIKLDVDKESDLISLAQYFVNGRSGSKHELLTLILQKFSHNYVKNDPMDILASMPIKTYWTTNYDNIIEKCIEKQNKEYDLKISDSNFSTTKENSDVTIYKFHGDSRNPESIVLTKDDYSSFHSTHQLFINALTGQLLTKTFLFIGYSFNDPDFLQILSSIRAIAKNVRTHYCLTKRIDSSEIEKKYLNTPDNTSEKKKLKVEYDNCLYEMEKQRHIVKDLKRFGINTVFVDDHKEIPILIAQIQKKNATRRIFIAGSCRDYGAWTEHDAAILMSKLGEGLIKKDYHISTGLIEGVGPQVVSGALHAIAEKNVDLSKYLSIKTLPLIKGKADHIDTEAKKMYQDDMIKKVGIVIFLFGNNFYDGQLQVSKGVLGDYSRALEHNKYIIPVGATGYAAKFISGKIELNINNFHYLKKFISRLNTETDPDMLVNTILETIEYIRDFEYDNLLEFFPLS